MSSNTQRLAQRVASHLRSNARHAGHARTAQHLHSSSNASAFRSTAAPGLQLQRCHFHRHSHTAQPFALTPARHFSSLSSDDDGNCSSSNDAAAASTSLLSPGALKESFSDVPGVESPGEKFVMVYTCVVCKTRSAKTISKHAYHKGVVLVRCPGCEKLHLIADRLGWFDDESVDVESILAAKGETVRVATNENVLELTDLEILGQMRKDE